MKLKTKREITEYLLDHRWYGGYLSWNIKINCTNFDISSGHSSPRIKNDPALDKAWEEFLNKNDIFWIVCGVLLDRLVNNNEPRSYFDYHPDKHVRESKYCMSAGGRSGGHLVLEGFDNAPVRFRQDADEIAEWDFPSLWRLYKFCLAIDELVESRYKLVADGYSRYRRMWEKSL